MEWNLFRSIYMWLIILCLQDEVLADGKVVIDLIDAIKPGSINYDLVLPGGRDAEEVSHTEWEIYLL